MSIGVLTNSKGSMSTMVVLVFMGKVGEEVLVTKVQWMDVKLHRMARDHVPMDGEEDEK